MKRISESESVGERERERERMLLSPIEKERKMMRR